MSSVLEVLKSLWESQEELTALIPPERVHLGPPNPGAELLCIGFTSERITQTGRTSHSLSSRVSVAAVAQAETPEALEKLHAAMRKHLETWSTDRYRSLVLNECSLSVSRSDDTPSQLWTGELSFEWQSVSV